MAIINAQTAQYQDVVNAVNLSSNGDTVNVPAGNVTWNSTLNLGTKAISLIGAGSNNTIITNSAGSLIRSNNTGNNLVRISGFRFNSGDTHVGIVAFSGPSYKARVDNCYFSKGDSAIGTNLAGMAGSGPVYGVADRCTFFNCIRSYFAQDVRTSDGGNWGKAANDDWAVNKTIYPGKEKMMYFEDCIFTWNAASTGPGTQCAVYGQYGGKVCIRKSTFNGWEAYVDAHAQSGAGMNFADGTVYYELYDNTMNRTAGGGSGSNVWRNDLVGTFIFHDNVINDSAPGPSTLTIQGYWQPNNNLLKDSFFWNNTHNGGAITIQKRDLGNTTPGFTAAHAVSGVDYFLRPIQPGDRWDPYTTYTYPHPLVSSGPPLVPISSESPSSIDFGSITSGQTVDIIASVTNSGVGTLVGSVATNGAPFSIVTGGGFTANYSLTANQSKNIKIRYAPTVGGTSSGVATFTDNGGGGSISLSGSATAIINSLTFAADEGTVASPFTVDGSHHVSQAVVTADPATGGRAAYSFNVSTAGNYKIVININAPDAASNSMFVAMDAEPVDPTNIWDTPITSGYQDKTVGWRGAATPEQVFVLSAGVHQLIIRGREATLAFGQITITPASVVFPPSTIPKGVFSLAGGGVNTSVDSAALGNPDVQGISIRHHWDDLEGGGDGIYLWQPLDDKIAQVESSGKDIILRIGDGGNNVPQWIKDHPGLVTFTFRDTRDGLLTIPVFWDAYFVQKKKEMIQAVGNRYASHPLIKVMAISFANSKSEDWGVPHSNVKEAEFGNTSEVDRWNAAGYSTDNMLSAGNDIMTTAMSAWPNQFITLAVGSNGNLDTPNGSDYVARTTVANIRNQFPGRLIVQKNSVSMSTQTAPPTAGSAWTLWYDSRPDIGGQMLWFSHGDDTCRNAVDPAPCVEADTLTQSIDKGVSYGIKFLEIYEKDVIYLTSVITYAKSVIGNMADAIVPNIISVTLSP